MKKLQLLTLLFFAGTALSAQDDVIRIRNCADSIITKQADSIRKQMLDGGFVMLREAMVAMESEYELPIIVPMTIGEWYQVIFIGNMTSKLYEVRMYDYGEKQVVYKKNQRAEIDGNIINYSYIPKNSEFHMIKPLQVNKKVKKNLCGCVMLLQKKVVAVER